MHLTESDGFSSSVPARKRSRQELGETHTGSQSPNIDYSPFNLTQTTAVEDFVASYREQNSRPFRVHTPSRVYPNAITVSSMLHALCNHYKVCSFQELLQNPSADPMQLQGLREIQCINERLWTFCAVYQQSRGIHTLYECYQAFLMQEQIEDFCDLGIGNSFRLTEAVQACYGMAQDSSSETLKLLPLKTYDVLRHLRAFDQQLHSESHHSFNEIRTGVRIHREDFLRYLTRKLSMELRAQYTLTQLGVFISASSFGQYIGLLRRISFQEKKELKALEAEFQKGVAERVFEITKEKFSSANRQHAIAECLKLQEKRWKSELHQNSSKGAERKASNTTSSSLSLEILRRVTSVDVYLDRELQRKLQAQSDTSKACWSISSHAIAEQDAKIRKRLKSCLAWTQKSCQYSRIKVVTWVVSGVIAKIYALLRDSDKVSASKLGASPEESQNIKESEDLSELEECACCCVGSDSCTCSCACACHQDSSDEEGLCEVTSEPAVEEVCQKERLKKTIVKFLQDYRQANASNNNKQAPLDVQWTVEMLCALEEHLKLEMSTSLGSISWLNAVRELQQDQPLLLSTKSESPSSKICVPASQMCSMNGINDRELSRFLHQYVINHGLDESNWNGHRKRIFTRLREHFGRQQSEFDESFQAIVSSKIHAVMVSAPAEADERIVYASALDVDLRSECPVPETLCERILAQLVTCPFLSHVEPYLQWEATYQRHFGSFPTFLSAYVASYITTQMIKSRYDFVLYVECSGKVWKLQHPDTVQLESLAKVSDQSDYKSLGRSLASQMASLMLQYRGSRHVPNALVTFYLREFFQSVSISKIDLILVGFCAAMSFSFGPYCLSLVLDAVQSIGIAGFSTRAHIYERIWNKVDLNTDRNSLCWIACLLEVPFWKVPMNAPPKVNVKLQPPQTSRVCGSMEPVDHAITSPKHTLPTADAPTQKACRALIESIRTSRLGLDIPQERENATRTVSTRGIFTLQQRRLDRALKRLSAELYAANAHFVLELLQNADDALYHRNVSPTCTFLITENKVEFVSNEIGFTEANIHALCDIGASTKESDTTCIGNKGIGFKSVFKISDRPQVHSNGYHMEFQASNVSESGMLGYIVPTWIEDRSRWREDCGTCIVLPFHEEAQRRKEAIVQAVHATIEPSLLLFLRQIKQLQVDEHNARICIRKQENWVRKYDNDIRWKHISLHVSSHEHPTSWLLVEKTIAIPKGISRHTSAMATRLVVAFPLGRIDPTYQKVFAYLPVRSYGLRCIVQGDFILPSSRESIDASNEWNQWLLTFLPGLFEHTATHLWRPESHAEDLAWISRDQFCRLLPVERHVEAPFRSIAREILQLLCKAHWVPSACDTLLAPCSLLEVSMDAVQVQGHDAAWLWSLLYRATHKRVLCREMSSNLSKEIKTLLQIESLQAIHVVRMLAVLCSEGESMENEIDYLPKLVVLLSFLSKLWHSNSAVRSDALVKEFQWIPCFPVISADGNRCYRSLHAAENGLYLPWKVKPAACNEIATLIQSFGHHTPTSFAIVEEAFLLQLNSSTLEFLTQTIGLETLDAHKVLEIQILPFLKAHIVSNSDRTQAVQENWIYCLLDHLHECHRSNLFQSCPVRLSGLPALPLITFEQEISREWIELERSKAFVLFTFWPAESEKKAVSLDAAGEIMKASDTEQVRFVCPAFLSELERRNSRERYLSKHRLWSDSCNVHCLWDLDSSAALNALNTILCTLVKAPKASVKQRGLQAFANCLQAFSPSPTSDRLHAHNFYSALRDLEWIEARDGAFYRPQDLWLPGKDPLIDTIVHLMPRSRMNDFASKWSEYLGFQQAISLTNVVGILRNIARASKDLPLDALKASSLALYQYLARNCNDRSKAAEIHAMFQNEAVYCLANSEASVVVASISDVVWSTSASTPSWHFPLDSMYPASLKVFFTDFCGVPETPSIHDICRYLTTTKSPLRPEALLSLMKHWSGRIKQYAMSCTELEMIQNAIKSPHLIWLPTTTEKRIGIPAANRFAVIACDETEAHIRTVLKQLCLSSKAFTPLGFDVIDLEFDDVEELLPLFTQTQAVVRIEEHVRSERYQWAKLLSQLFAQRDPLQVDNRQRLLIALLNVWASRMHLDTHIERMCPKYVQWRDLMQHEMLYPCRLPGSTRRLQSRSEKVFVKDTNELSESELKTLGISLLCVEDDHGSRLEREGSVFLTGICGIQSLKSHLVCRVCVPHTKAIREKDLADLEEQLRVDVLDSFQIFKRLLQAHYPDVYRTMTQDPRIVHFASALNCSITLLEPLQVRYELGHKAVVKCVQSAFERTCSTLYIVASSAEKASVNYLDLMRTCCNEWLSSGEMNVMSIANVLYLAWMQPHAAAREAFLQTTQQIPPLESIQTSRKKVLESDTFPTHSLTSSQTDSQQRLDAEWKSPKESMEHCSQTLMPRRSMEQRHAFADTFGENCFSAISYEERVATGRFGEEYVFHTLCKEFEEKQDASGAKIHVIWVNQERESGLPYDLKLVSSASGQTIHYIEVKSTRMVEKPSFEITMNEVEHASIHGSDYSIYRVFQAGKKWRSETSCRVIRIRDPIAQIRQKRIQLMAVMCASDDAVG